MIFGYGFLWTIRILATPKAMERLVKKIKIDTIGIKVQLLVNS
jgi:hypothetical protein